MSTPARRPTRPPSPKVLHFPLSRRTRRKPAPTVPLQQRKYRSQRGKLDSLFDQECRERALSFRRERVEERDAGDCFSGGFEEEKWRFQAEMLRAECRLLRTERERALKKLQRNRVKMETTLSSAVRTLAYGRKRISEGKNVNSTLKQEIENLEEKLEELQKDFETGHHTIVRKTMEGGKKGHNSNHVSTSASSSNDFSLRQFPQEEPPTMEQDNKCSGRCKAVVRRVMEQVRAETEQWSQMQEMLAQVRGEMEELQASRDFWENRAFNSDCEIQSLRHSVEEWKEKALRNENKANELQLKVSVLEETHKSKLDQPPAVAPLGKQLEKEKLVVSIRAKNYCTDVEDEPKERKTPKKDYFMQPLSLGKQLAKEKRMILRRLKEAKNYGFPSKGGDVSPEVRRKKSYSTVGILDPFRSPLMDVNSLSPLTRQSSRSGFGFFHSPESSRIREGFKKVISLNYA